jgi:hypothetical protein
VKNELPVVCFNKTFNPDQLSNRYISGKIKKKLKSSIFWDIMLCSKKQVASRAVSAICFMLVSFLAYSSTLKIEATCFSETSVDFQRTTRHIPDDRTLHTNGCGTSTTIMEKLLARNAYRTTS